MASRPVAVTICPVCRNHQTERRGGLVPVERFDPEYPVESELFVKEMVSLGRAKGFQTTGGLTLRQAAIDPKYRTLLLQLKARVDRIQGYLEAIL